MHPNECIFCKIITGKAPARVVYRDQTVTAFWDARPIAPVHILVVPNQHIISVNQTVTAHEPMLGHLITTARQIAIEQGVDQSGYRLVINTGLDAGQSIFHLHLHIIGGRQMPFHFR